MNQLHTDQILYIFVYTYEGDNRGALQIVQLQTVRLASMAPTR